MIPPLPAIPERYHLLDAFRGFLIINVIVFHFLFDVYILYGKNPAWASLPGVEFWRQCVCWAFIGMSGFVWTWGKHSSWQRGLLINFWGFMITLGSWLFFPAHIIWFGILNFIGTAILLMIGLHKLLAKIPPLLGMFISVLAYFIFRTTPQGFIALGNLFQITLPDWLYQFKIMALVGFPPYTFVSGDYFPLLPWFFIYLLGYFAYLAFASAKQLPAGFTLHIPVLSTVGTHSLTVYLLHQPVLLAICFVIMPRLSGN